MNSNVQIAFMAANGTHFLRVRKLNLTDIDRGFGIGLQSRLMAEIFRMSRVLINLAHPALHKSCVNRALIERVEGLDGVTIHDLYERYPEMHISADAEQELLRSHDVIVFQHPIYWYSSPAIVKEWQDVVLEHGFAFGPGGNALSGKLFISALSAGGSEDDYGGGGTHQFTLRQLLAPFEQTARLCGMRFLAPFVVHLANQLSPEQIRAAAADYRELIIALRDSTLEINAAIERRYITDGGLPMRNDKGGLL